MSIKSQSALARHVGISKQRINTLVKQGKLVLNEDRKIDTNNPANKELIDSMIDKNKTKETDSKKVYVEKNLPPVPGTRAQAELEHTRQKTLAAEKNNKLLEIKLAQAKKELVSTIVVRHVIQSTFSTFFNSLIQYPQNVADELIDIVNTKGEHARQAIIEKISKEMRTNIEHSIDHAEQSLKVELDKMTVKNYE